MTTMVMGVIDQAYVQDKTGLQSTGDVAQILEDQYHVMEVFYEENYAQIGQFVADSLADSLQTFLVTGVKPVNPFSQAEADIETLFKNFVLAKKFDGIMPGVPTKASLLGVNHALKIKKGPVRPSFKDTGLYLASFKTWFENYISTVQSSSPGTP